MGHAKGKLGLGSGDRLHAIGVHSRAGELIEDVLTEGIITDAAKHRYLATQSCDGCRRCPRTATAMLHKSTYRRLLIQLRIVLNRADQIPAYTAQCTDVICCFHSDLPNSRGNQ